MRRLVSASDLVLFAVLTVAGCWLVWNRPAGMREDSASTLAGALFGAAALLLGNWINRWNEASRKRVELRERLAKLKTMITARLVRVATALISSKRLADAALESAAAPQASVIVGPYPPQLTIIRDLGTDFPLLDERAIDALVTLESTTDITRRDLEQREASGVPISAMFGLRQVVEGIGHDLDILAQCFERIAPERKFEMDGRPAELVSTILRRQARLPRRVLDDEAL